MNNIYKEKKDVHDVLYEFVNNNEGTDLLLDQFIENVIASGDNSFSTGLLGVGWLISYLAYQKCIEIDVDDVLSDFDDNIYRITIQVILNNRSQLENILELITIHQQRLLNKSHPDNFYRRFPLHECLRLLLDKLAAIVNSEHITTPELMSKVVFKWSSLINIGNFEKNIEKDFYMMFENLIDHYKCKLGNLNEKDIESLYYLLLSAKQYKNPYWICCLDEILQFATKSNPTIISLKLISDHFSLDKELKFFTKNILDFEDKKAIIYLIASNLQFIKLR